jgi:hypothetical protein
MQSFQELSISVVKNNFLKQPPLSMAIQAAGLRGLFPQGQTASSHNAVSWLGEIRPTDYGRIYTVELKYKRGSLPHVWVREPNLHLLAGERELPHVYPETEELCLYFPGCGFWTPAKPIAFTIMQWASLWLNYFELWLVTNEWHGQGEHPRPKKMAA